MYEMHKLIMIKIVFFTNIFLLIYIYLYYNYIEEQRRNGKFIQNGNLGPSRVRVMKRRLYNSSVRGHVIERLGLNVSSFTHNCWSVVDGGSVTAAI